MDARLHRLLIPCLLSYPASLFAGKKWSIGKGRALWELTMYTVSSWQRNRQDKAHSGTFANTDCDKSVVEIQYLLGEAATYVREVKIISSPNYHPFLVLNTVQPDLEAG